MTRDEALANAIRLLQAAEQETDRSLLPELRCMADSWIAVADILSRENV